MKVNFCMLVLLFCSLFSYGQSDEEQIRVTINHYIEGTSYNDVPQINSAFYEEAELFLDRNGGELWTVAAKDYAQLFEKGEKGKFNGRIGNIIAVDIYGYTAIAKAEILVAGKKLLFMDMFILKKINGQWKIVSKAASSKSSNRTGDRVLFVMSNATHYGTSDLPTGNSFSEIVNAYDVFSKAGYEINFVSPQGGAIPLAYIQTSEKLEKEYLYNSDFMFSLKTTLEPQKVNPSLYKAIYYVGGGGAMFGVAENVEIQKIAMTIYEENEGIISSVCHGTAGIVNLKTKNGDYLVKGKRVNGYPDSYENREAKYFKYFPFLIQKTIEERGGNFLFSPRNTEHVEADGRLITGQNFQSAKGVAEKIIETLKLKNN